MKVTRLWIKGHLILIYWDQGQRYTCCPCIKLTISFKDSVSWVNCFKMLATKEKGDDQGQQAHYNLSRLIVTTSSGTIQKASTWELWEVNNSREIGEERQGSCTAGSENSAKGLAWGVEQAWGKEVGCSPVGHKALPEWGGVPRLEGAIWGKDLFPEQICHL